MYGLTRGALTLIGAAVAGLLLWLAVQVFSDTNSASDYWLGYAIVAAAGLVMALSQLLGGWTKWGWPRISGNVFLLGFLPTLIAGGWILAVGEPDDHWLGRHVSGWTTDIGIDGVVGDLTAMIPAIAFGIGLVFGLTFDTTGPRSARTKGVPAGGAQKPTPATHNGPPVDEDRRVRLDDGERVEPESEPEPAPRSEEPAKK